MLDQYLPILLQILIVVGFAATTLVLSVLFGKSGRRNSTKDSAYECGVPALTEGQPRFSIKFYMIAMLFVIFDLEAVFLFPWAVAFRDSLATHGYQLFWSMTGFIAFLTVGYLYALNKGVFNWKKN